jgi:hypothetical protein
LIEPINNQQNNRFSDLKPYRNLDACPSIQISSNTTISIHHLPFEVDFISHHGLIITNFGIRRFECFGLILCATLEPISTSLK